MVKLKREMKEYIEEYYSSLEKTDIKEKELYLRVLENSLELAKTQEQFEELLSFGNEYVSRNTGMVKNLPQLKYNLKSIMEKRLETISNEKQLLVPYIEEETDPYEIYNEKEMIQIAMDALKEIDPNRRNAIEKVIIEGLTYREAAHECDCGHETVRNNINKGILEMQFSVPVSYYRFFDNDPMTQLVEIREEKIKKLRSKNI